MDQDIRAAKKALRSRVRDRLAVMTPEERERRSFAIRRALAGTEAFRTAALVAAYYPLPEEPDILPLLEQVLTEGRTLALPRVQGGLLRFRRVADFRDCLPGYRGVREPREGLPVLGTEDFTVPAGGSPDGSEPGAVILVPGLAFDLRGGRLGRGKGFYDRFLGGFSPFSCLGEPRIVGVAFAVQLVPDVPMGGEDRRVDFLVTDEGFFPVPGKGRLLDGL